MSGDPLSKKTRQYAPKVEEFRLELTVIDEGEENEEEVLELSNEKQGSNSKHHSIALVYDGRGSVNGMDVKKGDCLLIPPEIEELKVKGDAKKGVKLARCFAPMGGL